MDKETLIYTHIYVYNGILFNYYQEWNSVIFNDVGGPRDYYAKWNKSDKYCMLLHIDKL